MLRFPIGQSSDCQALSRRQFLQVGGVGAFGLSLPGLLRSQATGRREAAKGRQLHPALDERRSQPS